MRSLGLLSVAHAINHAQAVVLPLIFLKIVDEFGVGVDTIAFLAAIGAFLAGAVQLSYAGLTRVVSRRRLLGIGLRDSKVHEYLGGELLQVVDR